MKHVGKVTVYCVGNKLHRKEPAQKDAGQKRCQW